MDGLSTNLPKIHQFNTMRFGVYAALFADAGKIWDRPELSVNALGEMRVEANGGVTF